MTVGRVVATAAGQPVPVVLTCGDSDCRRTFEPDRAAFAAGSLACPGCGGWTFGAELVQPGGDRR